MTTTSPPSNTSSFEFTLPPTFSTYNIGFFIEMITLSITFYLSFLHIRHVKRRKTTDHSQNLQSLMILTDIFAILYVVIRNVVITNISIEPFLNSNVALAFEFGQVITISWAYFWVAFVSIERLIATRFIKSYCDDRQRAMIGRWLITTLVLAGAVIGTLGLKMTDLIPYGVILKTTFVLLVVICTLIATRLLHNVTMNASEKMRFASLEVRHILSKNTEVYLRLQTSFSYIFMLEILTLFFWLISMACSPDSSCYKTLLELQSNSAALLYLSIIATSLVVAKYSNESLKSMFQADNTGFAKKEQLTPVVSIYSNRLIVANTVENNFTAMKSIWEKGNTGKAVRASITTIPQQKRPTTSHATLNPFIWGKK